MSQMCSQAVLPCSDEKSGLHFLLPACLAVCVSFTGCSTSTNGASTTPVTPTAANPTVSSISPAVLPSGAAAMSLIVSGTGYTTSSSVQVGGVVEPSTNVSATQLTAAVPAAQLA